MALINPAGLRADLPKGEVTLGHVQDAFHFYNFLGEGGDLCQTFLEGGKIESIDKDMASIIVEHL